MAEQTRSRPTLGQFIFALVAIMLIIAQLLPLETRPATWAAPDWLLAVTLVWVSRRPEYAPVTLIAAIFLIADFVFQRPPGLWAALVVMLTEVIRARSKTIRNLPFSLEWGTVAVGILAIVCVNRVVLTLVLTPRPPFGLTVIQSGMTIVFYPLMVGIAYILFGINRPALGQVDNRGHRL